MGGAIVNGIVVGAIPGLLAVGIVLIFKGSRAFNFAQAEFGTVAAYAAWIFVAEWNLPYAVGAVGAVGVGAAMGFVVERLVVRPLFDAPRVTILVATAGVALLVGQLENNVGGVFPRSVPPAVQGLGPEVFGVFVSPQRFLVFATLAGLAAVFAWFFRRIDLGNAILASSQDPFAAELSGISSRRISSVVWTLAGALGGLAGVLYAGTNVAIVPGFVTRSFLLAAFAAAVLGGMTSLPGAFIGGELVGLAGSLAEYANARVLDGVLPGPGNVVLLLLVVGVLVARPQGILGKPEAMRV